jgi:transcriptional regulator with XRE-family HTH domain
VFKDSVRDAISAEVARLLSEERKSRGLSMNALAARSGLSQSFVSSFETQPWNPTLDSLLRMTSAMDVDLGDLIARAIQNTAGTAAKGSGNPSVRRRQ